MCQAEVEETTSTLVVLLLALERPEDKMFLKFIDHGELGLSQAPKIPNCRKPCECDDETDKHWHHQRQAGYGGSRRCYGRQHAEIGGCRPLSASFVRGDRIDEDPVDFEVLAHEQ